MKTSRLDRLDSTIVAIATVATVTAVTTAITTTEDLETVTILTVAVITTITETRLAVVVVMVVVAAAAAATLLPLPLEVQLLHLTQQMHTRSSMHSTTVDRTHMPHMEATQRTSISTVLPTLIDDELTDTTGTCNTISNTMQQPRLSSKDRLHLRVRLLRHLRHPLARHHHRPRLLLARHLVSV